MISPLMCEAGVNWPGHTAWKRAISHHNEHSLISDMTVIVTLMTAQPLPQHPNVHWQWLKSLLVLVTLALRDLASQGLRCGWELSVSQRGVVGAGQQCTSSCSPFCSKQYPPHSPALTFIPHATLSEPDTPHVTVTGEEKDKDAAVTEIKRN